MSPHARSRSLPPDGALGGFGRPSATEAMNANLKPLRRQRGATLVVGMVMLVMLGMIGVVSYAVASMEDRMVGNTREGMRAFESAEASLRDCEAPLGGVGSLPSFDGTGGMYEAAAVSAMPRWQSIDWNNAAQVRVLANELPEVGRQPRCIVELISMVDEMPIDGAVSGPQVLVQQTVFRVTSMGYGRNVAARVQLQSTFRRQ